MATVEGLLERLYLKDLVQFLTGTFSRLIPKFELNPIAAFSPLQRRNGILSDDSQGWWKTIFAIFGASVFMTAAPLVCCYLWYQLRSSRAFTKNASEVSNLGMVITGCDSGIGIETAAVLSGAYPSVMIFAGCLTVGGEQRLASLDRPNLIPARLDVTSDADVHAFVNLVRSRLGNRKLYALINNAGIFDGAFFEVTPMEIYYRVMNVHFFGTVRVTKAFLPMLVRGQNKEWGGRILMVSSVGGMMASPGSTAYCAAKHAVASFSDGLRQELKEQGIKVMQVIPGAVKTGSLRQIPISANTLLSTAPDDVLQRYGGPTFLTAYGEFFSELYDYANPPVNVAMVIQKALMARYPRDLYYEVDSIYTFLSICPHYLRDFLMDPKNFRKQIIKKYVK